MNMSETFQQINAYAKSRGIPMIPTCAKDFSVLKEPNAFYESLLKNSRSARQRIVLSALYIGTGSKEKKLVKALCDNLANNSKLNVNILLDYNRARRVDSCGESSISILQHLLNHDNVTLNLVKNQPKGVIESFLERYRKWNELFSVYHSKILVFDNDVILTGANLSSIYFEKRQDRYVRISNSKLLSDYIYSFFQSIGSQPLDQLINSHNAECIEKLDTHSNADCYILPLCQHGPSGVTHCDDFLNFLEVTLPKSRRIHMSSGYFNPKLKLTLQSVLVPSEQANGFHNGSGLLAFVPRIYSAFLKKYKIIHPGCLINLYEKPGWSFHAKGLWIDGLDNITLNMIGSSNFNWRSSTRDIEMQFVIITSSQSLRNALREEYQDLCAESRTGDLDLVNSIYNTVSNMMKSLL